ncbi:hypothetical protein [Streptomyces sp. NPDC003006]
MIGSRLEKFSDHDSDETGADGICGLAAALYVIAVSRDDVDELIRRRPGEKDPDIVRRWETHLQLAGHNLEDPTDPDRQARRSHLPGGGAPGSGRIPRPGLHLHLKPCPQVSSPAPKTVEAPCPGGEPGQLYMPGIHAM